MEPVRCFFSCCSFDESKQEKKGSKKERREVERKRKRKEGKTIIYIYI